MKNGWLEGSDPASYWVHFGNFSWENSLLNFGTVIFKGYASQVHQGDEDVRIPWDFLSFCCAFSKGEFLSSHFIVAAKRFKI